MFFHDSQLAIPPLNLVFPLEKQITCLFQLLRMDVLFHDSKRVNYSGLIDGFTLAI